MFTGTHNRLEETARKGGKIYWSGKVTERGRGSPIWSFPGINELPGCRPGGQGKDGPSLTQYIVSILDTVLGRDVWGGPLFKRF
jgi:hypothetical protein